MEQARARDLLVGAGAIIEGHFVGTNGSHLSVYVAKDRATRLPTVASELCAGIAELFVSDDVDVVVGPAVGSIALSQWTAYHLTRLRHDRPEVYAVYTEPNDTVIREGESDCPEISTLSIDGMALCMIGRQKIILRSSAFVLKRGFQNDVEGRRVLVVEDTVTTGGSASRTVHAVVFAGGIVVGLGVLANGGNVTPHMCGVGRLEALTTVDRQVYSAEDCAVIGLCAQGIPVNTDFGHGKAFLARKEKRS